MDERQERAILKEWKLKLRETDIRDLEAWHRNWEREHESRRRREAYEKHYEACGGCRECCDPMYLRDYSE